MSTVSASSASPADVPDPDGETRAVETEPGAYQRFYEGVVAAVRDGAPPPVAAEEAVEDLAVLDAAQASARDGRVVELDPG